MRNIGSTNNIKTFQLPKMGQNTGFIGPTGSTGPMGTTGNTREPNNHKRKTSNLMNFAINDYINKSNRKG